MSVPTKLYFNPNSLPDFQNTSLNEKIKLIDDFIGQLHLYRFGGVWTIMLHSKSGKNIYHGKGDTQKECLDEMFNHINEWWGSL
jgi:hypothetical protein